MDDLKERLRNYRPTNEWGDGVHHVICDEAAARIQALETSLAEAGEQLRTNAETLAQVPAAIAEARRQALEEAAKVAGELEVSGKTTTMEWANCMAHARDIAQAIRALASDPLLDRQGE